MTTLSIKNSLGCLPRRRVFSLISLALAATALTFGLVGHAQAALSPQFVVPGLTRTTGVLPQDLATADFNNDGNADVAVANLGPDAFFGGVDVMLGDGAGHLGSPIRTQLGTQNGAYQVAAGDFNGDGKADLAVLTGTTGGYGPIFILLGTGTGTFTLTTQQLAAGQGHIAVADLTGDGKQDIVFVFSGGLAQVKLFAGNGDGTFSGPTLLNRDFDAFDFKLADLNSDGKLDIVGAAGGPVWSMLNLGGGQFSQQISSFSLSGLQLALADFTGDGKLDVAMVNASGGEVQIGLGAGDGSFTLFKTYPEVSFDTLSIAAGDFTGDGKADLIVNNGYACCSQSNIAVLMKGKGDGTFNSFTYWATGNNDPTPVQLNGDSLLDLVTFSSDPGQVYATLNAGHGKFKAPQSLKVTGLGSPTKGDVNGDSKLDLVMMGVVLPRPGVLTVRVFTYLNLGGGRFSKAIISKTQNIESGDGPTQVVLADVNEDGKPDLVAGFTHLFPKVGNVWVLLGDGTGKFTNLAIYDTGDVHTSNLSIAVADVTGDGHLDIIGNALGQLSVLPGSGAGTFGSPILSGSTGSTPIDTFVADFTADGVPDVVAVIPTGSEDFGSGELRLERGNGDGTFSLTQTRTFDGTRTTRWSPT